MGCYLHAYHDASAFHKQWTLQCERLDANGCLMLGLNFLFLENALLTTVVWSVNINRKFKYLMLT